MDNDGSLSFAKTSGKPNGTGSACELAKTRARSTASEERAFMEAGRKKPVGSAGREHGKKGTFPTVELADGMRRNETPRRIEALRSGGGASSPRRNVYQPSKMWEPVSVANTFPSYPSRTRTRCRGKGSPDLISTKLARRPVVHVKSRLPSGKAAENPPSTNSTRPSLRGSQWPRSQTPVLAPLEGDCEDICELEIDGHGLLQVFRTGDDYGGRILERAGPFSRTSTVPLFCKGFSDPREATRALARLPQSALRRRVHVLSDRSPGAKRFVFLGDLGLRGGGAGQSSYGMAARGRQTADDTTTSRSTMRRVGGDGEPPTGGDALGHQTVAESSTTSPATGSALTGAKRSPIQRIVAEGSYQSLVEIVEAFNEASDVEQKAGLAGVIRRIIHAFNDMPLGDATDDEGAVVREYLALCRLDTAGGEHLPLLKDFFDGLRDKLCSEAPSNRYLVEAIELTLQSVDVEVFEDGPRCLVQLAQFLLDVLDPEKTSFSREMFPIQCSALHAVHECLRILRDAGSADWDTYGPGELHAKLEDSCRRVIDVSGYYPIKYQAMLVQHILASSQSSKRSVHNVKNARRTAGHLYGTAGVHRAVRKAVHLDFDLGDAESATRALLHALLHALLQSRRSNVDEEEQCRTYFHALNTAHFAAMEDPSTFEVFSELVSSLAREGRASGREHCKLLRFGVVEMLNMLSIHGKDGDVGRASAETLASLVERTDEWDWSSDADLFSELLDNLEELSVRGQEHERRATHDAIERLVSNVQNAACEVALSEWRGRKKVDEEIDEEIESVSPGEEKTADDMQSLRARKSLEDELPPPTTEDRSRPKKRHSLISPYIVPHFAGRKEEFGELVEAFTSSSESVVIKAVVGQGGLGKTQFAIKVFEHLKRKGSYDNEFWIHSDSRESLSAAFLQIAECMEIPVDADTPEPVKLVHEKLGGSRCLFVFDDAPNLEMIREYLPPAAGHAIVTTRDTEVGGDWDGDVIRLGQFDECDAWFLAEKFGYTRASHSDGLEDLLDLLPPYPLALAQFFSLMEYNEVSSPAEWLHRAKHYAPPRREAEIVKVLSAEHNVEGASARVYLFNASALMISKEPDGLGTHAIDTLSKLALVDPNGVPVEWMYEWHGPHDGESTTKMQQSLKLLERFSHVSWDRDTNQVYIHAETQLLARHLLLDIYQNTSDRKERCEENPIENAGNHIDAIVDSVGRYVGAFRTDTSNRELWASLARNGLPLLEHSKTCDNTGAEMKLVEHMANAYREMCMFRESLSYLRRALGICESLHTDADHPDLINCIRNYAVGLEKTGGDNEAFPFYKRALEMCERLHGDTDHPDLFSCMKSYAVALERTGRDNDALPLYKRALEMCERLYGGMDHPDLVSCIRYYAVGLERTGSDNEALPLYKRALEMCERLHGDADHPDLVGCMKCYAIGLERAGRVNEALPVYERALEMCERLYGGVDHPDLVSCMRCYAIGLERSGRVNEALPFNKRALEMCEHLHGDTDHPDLFSCMKSFAIGLERTGRDNEALPLYKRALEMCERLFGGVDHPDLVNSIRNYAVGLERTGRDNEALPIYKRALEMCERLYSGVDHPDLVGCMKCYAIGLERTGRDNEALPVYKRTLEMCERLYGGVDHPDLVGCMKCYAIGLERSGRFNEALPLYKRALEMCERLYGGMDHPDLVGCLKCYAIGLERTGRDNEALPFYMRALEMCERLYGGVDHPDLVSCMKCYAVALERTGRDNDALPFYMRALEMCERLYGGVDHPDLVSCIRYYAVGLERTGRDDEALPLYMKALEMCERLHGDADHPDLVGCMKCYAIGLERSGRDNEALLFHEKANAMRERLSMK